MPVSSLTWRCACGGFYSTFLNYMTKREEAAIVSQVKVITLHWPLTFAFTSLVACVLIVSCMDDTRARGEHSTRHANKEEGGGRWTEGNSKTPSTLSMTLQMWAVANRFRKQSARFSQHWGIGLSPRVKLGQLVTLCVIVTVVGVFTACSLLLCGDVESNPGPGNASGHPLSLEQLRADMTDTVHYAMEKLEQITRQQGNHIDKRLDSVEDKLHQRLDQVEASQERLARSVAGLYGQCQDLWLENKGLRGKVNFLTEKCDYIENQNRRNNLVFDGFPLEKDKSESWDECELKIKKVIREGLEVTEEIHIERAHRAGKAIVARFLSYKQKMLVIRNAKKLKDSGRYSNIFIREDFSHIMQRKRRELVNVQQAMRRDGLRSMLRYDKLLTDTDVYTYDILNERVLREERRAAVVGADDMRRKAWYGNQSRDNGRRQGWQNPANDSNISDLPSRSPRVNTEDSQHLLWSEDYPPLPTPGRRDDVQWTNGLAAAGNREYSKGNAETNKVNTNTIQTSERTENNSDANLQHKYQSQHTENVKESGHKENTVICELNSDQSRTYNLRNRGTKSNTQTTNHNISKLQLPTPARTSDTGMYSVGRGKTRAVKQGRIDHLFGVGQNGAMGADSGQHGTAEAVSGGNVTVDNSEHSNGSSGTQEGNKGEMEGAGNDEGEDARIEERVGDVSQDDPELNTDS